MAVYPALDVYGVEADLALAVAQDHHPTAAEDHPDHLTVFFQTASNRDRARDALVRAFPDSRTTVRDVDDEDWARRSQENLGTVTVGRLTIAPPWSSRPAPFALRASAPEALPPLWLVIQPSMGFGTGHHATTRLCLAALQELELAGREVLDVGTGSGVLALAARCLGAKRALGIDYDPDAIRSAEENLSLNPSIDGVSFQLGDLATAQLPPSDVVVANLTGAHLISAAAMLTTALRPGGALIVSGLLPDEETDVSACFAQLHLRDSLVEDEWVCLRFESPAPGRS